MRLIAKIDIKNNQVIKSIKYDGVRKIGHPNEVVENFYERGIDELFLVNVTGSLYDYSDFKKQINNICKKVFIPITIGGGIRKLDDIKFFFDSGADKISLNSILFEKNIIEDVANIYGSQSVTITIQAKFIDNDWYVFSDMARKNSKIKIKDWIKQCILSGAGEIIIIDVDRDGTCKGLNFELIDYLNIFDKPTIFGGGFNPATDSLNLRSRNIDGVSLASYIYKKNFDLKKFKLDLS